MNRYTMIAICVLCFSLSVEAKLTVIPSKGVSYPAVKESDRQFRLEMAQVIVDAIESKRSEIVSTLGTDECPLKCEIPNHSITIQDGLPFIQIPESDKWGYAGYTIGDRFTKYGMGASGGWKQLDDKRKKHMVWEHEPSDSNKLIIDGVNPSTYSRLADDEHGFTSVRVKLVPFTAQAYRIEVDKTVNGISKEESLKLFEELNDAFHKKHWRKLGGYVPKENGNHVLRTYISNAFPDLEITLSTYFMGGERGARFCYTIMHTGLSKMANEQGKMIGAVISSPVDDYCRKHSHTMFTTLLMNVSFAEDGVTEVMLNPQERYATIAKVSAADEKRRTEFQAKIKAEREAREAKKNEPYKPNSISEAKVRLPEPFEFLGVELNIYVDEVKYGESGELPNEYHGFKKYSIRRYEDGDLRFKLSKYAKPDSDTRAEAEMIANELAAQYGVSFELKEEPPSYAFIAETDKMILRVAQYRAELSLEVGLKNPVADVSLSLDSVLGIPLKITEADLVDVRTNYWMNPKTKEKIPYFNKRISLENYNPFKSVQVSYDVETMKVKDIITHYNANNIDAEAAKKIIDDFVAAFEVEYGIKFLPKREGLSQYFRRARFANFMINIQNEESYHPSTPEKRNHDIYLRIWNFSGKAPLMEEDMRSVSGRVPYNP